MDLRSMINQIIIAVIIVGVLVMLFYNFAQKYKESDERLKGLAILTYSLKTNHDCGKMKKNSLVSSDNNNIVINVTCVDGSDKIQSYQRSDLPN